MNSVILVDQTDDFKYLFTGPRAFVRGFCIHAEVFVQAVMFVPEEVYSCVHIDDFDFDYLIVNAPGHCFVVCH